MSNRYLTALRNRRDFEDRVARHEYLWNFYNIRRPRGWRRIRNDMVRQLPPENLGPMYRQYDRAVQRARYDMDFADRWEWHVQQDQDPLASVSMRSRTYRGG